MVQISRRLAVAMLATIAHGGISTRRVSAQTPSTVPFADVAVPNVVLDLKVRKLPLPDFLNSLSMNALSSGAADIKFVLGRNTSVERISVFAKRMPLPEILKNVATLYGWEWSSGKDRTDGKDILTLDLSIQRRGWERRRWSALVSDAFLPVQARERAEREARTARERSAKAAVAAAKDPTQRQAREKEYTWLKARAAACQLTMTLSRNQKQQLWEQERLYIPWVELTPQQRDLAVAIAMPYNKELPSRLTQTGVTLSVTPEPVTGLILEFNVTASGMGSNYFSTDVAQYLGREKSSPPVRGNPYTTPDREIPAKEEAVTSLPVTTSAVAPTAIGGDYAEQERAPFPDNLHFTPEDLWGDILSKLAKVIDKPLFSDGYSAARGIRQPPTYNGKNLQLLSPPTDELLRQSGSLAAGLDLLCRAYNMVWWQENGALFFRSRTWLSERRYEVPAAIRTSLLARIRNAPHGRTRDDQNPEYPALLQTLSGLSLQQLQGLTGTEKKGDYLEYALTKSERLPVVVLARSFMQFYNSLSAEQQRIAWSREGLPAESMTDQQRDALITAIAAERGVKAVVDVDQLYFGLQVDRLRDLPRDRSEPQASAVAMRFLFADHTGMLPGQFAMIVEEEKPQPDGVVRSLSSGND